jgi:hypothetical protein
MLSRIPLTFIRLNRVLRAAGLSTSSLLKEVVIHGHTPGMAFGPEEPFVPSFPRKRESSDSRRRSQMDGQTFVC